MKRAHGIELVEGDSNFSWNYIKPVLSEKCKGDTVQKKGKPKK